MTKPVSTLQQHRHPVRPFPPPGLDRLLSFEPAYSPAYHAIWHAVEAGVFIPVRAVLQHHLSGPEWPW